MVERIARRGFLCAILLATACATDGSGNLASERSQAGELPAPRAAQKKVITIGIRADLNAPSTDLDIGGAKSTPSRFAHEFLNAYFVVRDHNDEIQPLLAERLPSLDDGSWQVLVDGRMIVTWKLRPNAKWHDGQDLTSDDVKFGWEVGSDPLSQVGRRGIARLVDQVETPDAHTVVLHWTQTNYLGGQMGERELEVLPRHLLGDAFLAGKETFHQKPYFTTAGAFVGSGPYRLVDWMRDDQFTVEAFDQFFLGRPKIDRVVFRVVPDSRTALASVLAGTIDVAFTALEYEEGRIVKGEWDRTGAGTVKLQPTSFQYLSAQMRPEHVNPADLLNPTVRKALIYALNRAEIAEAASPGAALPSETNTLNGTPLGDVVIPRVTAHPYDARRAAALLEEAGWQPGPDGSLQKNGERFRLELRVRNTDNQTASLFALMQQHYRAIGLELSQVAAIGRDPTLSVFYPGFLNVGGVVNQQAVFQVFQTRYIATVENRWTGINYSGYSNPVFDRAVQEIDRSVRRADQQRWWAEAWRALTDDAGITGLYITSQPYAVRNGISGAVPASPVGSPAWAIQQWDLR